MPRIARFDGSGAPASPTSTSSNAKCKQAAEPVAISKSAALAKKASVEAELSKMADDEVRATGDIGPHAHAMAVARILRTPRGRQLSEAYNSALLESARATEE